MKMTPVVRKVALTAHVTASVSWLGAVACFLALSIAGLTSRNVEIVHGAYLAMNMIGESIIIPLSLAALLTGIVQSLGTDWGLFRHYWVLVKLVLALGSTALLLRHQYSAVAEAARLVSTFKDGTLPRLNGLGKQLVFDAGLAVFVLFGITALSVFKPWGRTRYGRRILKGEQGKPSTGMSSIPTPGSSNGLPTGLKILLAAVGLFVVVIIASHLAGGGFRRHGH